jgi:hypothetical protein
MEREQSRNVSSVVCKKILRFVHARATWTASSRGGREAMEIVKKLPALEWSPG